MNLSGGCLGGAQGRWRRRFRGRDLWAGGVGLRQSRHGKAGGRKVLGDRTLEWWLGPRAQGRIGGPQSGTCRPFRDGSQAYSAPGDSRLKEAGHRSQAQGGAWRAAGGGVQGQQARLVAPSTGPAAPCIPTPPHVTLVRAMCLQVLGLQVFLSPSCLEPSAVHLCSPLPCCCPPFFRFTRWSILLNNLFL